MARPEDLEVPEAVRQLAEKNVEQSRAAYNKFMEMARRAQETFNQSSGAVAEGALEVQAKALSYAEKNMESGFDLLSELATARDLKEYLEIQSRHTEKSMKAYGQQAQELSALISELAQKSQKTG
ncbi:MAG: phasin family protein [Hyphomicrobiaceae bacterium]